MKKIYNENLVQQALSNNEIESIMENGNLTDDEICKQLFHGRDQEYVWKACWERCWFYCTHAPDGAETPDCLGHWTLFVASNFRDSTKFTIRESYSFYVKHERVWGEIGESNTPQAWWEAIANMIDFWEQHDPETFSFSNKKVRGFF